MLGAQTEGMIGYLIQQELGNELPSGASACASLLTLIEVDRDDPAFDNPTKPIGPIYRARRSGAARSGRRVGCSSQMAPASDGSWLRPLPRRIFGIEPVEWLLEHHCVVICAGRWWDTCDVFRHVSARRSAACRR